MSNTNHETNTGGLPERIAIHKNQLYFIPEHGKDVSVFLMDNSFDARYEVEYIRADIKQADSEKQKMSAFAEWIKLNRFCYSYITGNWERKFSHGETEYKTSEELYDMYKTAYYISCPEADSVPVEDECIAFGEWLRSQRPDVFHGNISTEQLYIFFKQSTTKTNNNG